MTTRSSISGNDTRRFIYAPDGRVLGEYGGSANDVHAEFIWMSPEVGEASGDSALFGGDDGLGGYMPLTVAANDNGVSQLSWVHGNHMGVPAVYTDASGSETGFPTGYSAPGFPGQSRTFTDLYYNRYRDYDTVTGRYIQADPIGLAGGPSPYSYAMNNPLRYTDPTGEFVPLVPIIASIAFGVGFEYFTNQCATAGDLILAGAIGGIGGGIGKLGLLRHGPRSLTRITGKEWSHPIPKRTVDKYTSGALNKALNRRGGLNGSWVKPGRHFKHDTKRWPKGHRDLGDRYWKPLRGLDRLPDWTKASAGSGTAGAAVSGNGNNE